MAAPSPIVRPAVTPVRTSIATVCLAGTLPEKLDAAAAAGFAGIEVFEPDLVASSLRPREIAAAAADRGLIVDMYQPFRDLDSSDPMRFSRNLVRLQRKFDVMDDLDTDLLLVCSSPSPDAVADDALLVDQLGAAADLAAARGKRLAYEALAWGRHVHDYRLAARLVSTVDHPALGTCIDSFHILSRGLPPEPIADLDPDSIFFLQLADAPLMVMDVLQWSRHHRCLPGQGGFDLPRFMRAVDASGYAGPWSLEVFNDVFRHADPTRIARDARRSLRYLAETTRHELAVPDDEILSGGEVTAGDVVSIRIAAGPTKAPQVERMLSQIGFDLQGVDSATGLRLHRDADVAVVVDPSAGTVWTAPGSEVATIAQIALRTGDPAAWARRAESFDVPVAPVPVPGGDPDAAGDAVVRLDVTDVLSVDLRGPVSRSLWRDRFDLVPRDRHEPAALFDGVDHIGVGVSPADWETAMLLLRSVFGMRVEEGMDIPDAVGTLRSQALTVRTDTGGTLRIVASLLPDRMAGTGPVRRRGGLTHAAFACSDIFAAAAACRERGLRPVVIPDNYYDDLASRVDLPADVVERMRREHILYDADGTGGEFWHFVTPTIGDDLFFEVACRTGGYRGYGEVNSAVRVAAVLAADT
ncbi:sugar phosphate isomerase/epimerase and 4-hydroxyphenylpyruvate domain-containing protein [Williamsia serinedens]|uniref:3-dehydroshikimate dehydratase n=1 Tax=Williamsia serinedens TaxID=391736 RepID=A0ABT1H1L6_9NOCA|nr:sugar phosphate isomerase/epimerase and 4-hydroxyphenylpyruvate domain-containing protein [Williamsia serinedens]MCP2160647.1 4-hydroxyphenylpyruvate dioxygenase [Williamsia serinedens]